MINGITDDGRVDLVDRFAFPLPVGVVFSLIGYPEKDTALLKSWCSDRLKITWGRPLPDEQLETVEKMASFFDYIETFVHHRAGDLQDDYTSDLLRTRAEDVSVHGLDSESPEIHFSKDGSPETLNCDYVAGCDGFFGVCRPSVPEAARNEYTRTYPFGWIGILVEGPPSMEELIYALHDRSFALVSTRSPRIQRLYFQCDPEDTTENWPNERVWRELQTRLATEDGWTLQQGEIFLKDIVRMRSFACEPSAANSSWLVTPRTSSPRRAQRA